MEIKKLMKRLKSTLRKKTETVTVTKTDVGNAGDVKVIYDFEKVKYNVCMIH